MIDDKTLEEWEKEADELLGDTKNMPNHLATYMPEITDAEKIKKLISSLREAKKEIADLREALEEIAKPENWKHTEPDAVTQLGCLMHHANEALGRKEGKTE